MMGRQARPSIRVMRLWKPHDPGRPRLHSTIGHHVTNETDSQNDGALAAPVRKYSRSRPTSRSTPFPGVTCSELPGSYPASDGDPHDRNGDGTACYE